MAGEPLDVEKPVIASNGHGLSQRELILELRTELATLRADISSMQVQVNQIANDGCSQRIDDLERWKDRADGRMDLLIRGVPFLSGALGIASAAFAVLAVGSI